MSESLPTIPPTPPGTPDRVTTVSKLTVSVVAEITFVVCMSIAWWTKNETAFNLLVGAAISNSTTVVNYWLGGSSGSTSKDATIAAAIGNKP